MKSKIILSLILALVILGSSGAPVKGSSPQSTPIEGNSLSGITPGVPASPTAPKSPNTTTPLGTAFSYQGQLNLNGHAVSGTCDFTFALYNQASGGTSVPGSPLVTLNGVAVANGLFTVLLDFGNVFDGLAKWLEIGVVCPSGSGAATLLTPRQPLSAAVYSQPGPDTAAAANVTPMQLAVKKWGWTSQADYPTGSFPVSIAFDGEFIWTANEFASNVTKIRASDGLSVSYAAGPSPAGVLFDGANIWVANFANPGTLTKLRASDGTNLGTFPTGGTGANWMAFDGTYVWVTNQGGSVARIRASDGSNQGTYAFPSGSRPFGIAYDGNAIWVTDENHASLTKLSPADGSVLQTVTVGTTPMDVLFDGTNLWVANMGANNVMKIRPSDGLILGTFPCGGSPLGLAFDGTSIWVSAFTTPGSLNKLRPSDGQILGTYPAGNGPAGLGFDGAFIWSSNTGSATASKR